MTEKNSLIAFNVAIIIGISGLIISSFMMLKQLYLIYTSEGEVIIRHWETNTPFLLFEILLATYSTITGIYLLYTRTHKKTHTNTNTNN